MLTAGNEANRTIRGEPGRGRASPAIDDIVTYSFDDLLDLVERPEP